MKAFFLLNIANIQYLSNNYFMLSMLPNSSQKMRLIFDFCFRNRISFLSIIKINLNIIYYIIDSLVINTLKFSNILH